jgi:DDE superfamily endonuclease
LPYDPRFPVVGMDEMPKQLIAETRIPLPVCEGHPVLYDYEDERKGVCNLFLFVEPLRGWRKVFVRDRRTKVDWAECVRVVLDQIDPKAIRVRLVQDNLNTHTIGSLYEAFAPEEARRLACRLEIHPTPVHGSWLNKGGDGTLHPGASMPRSPPGCGGGRPCRGRCLGSPAQPGESHHQLAVHGRRCAG